MADTYEKILLLNKSKHRSKNNVKEVTCTHTLTSMCMFVDSMSQKKYGQYYFTKYS